jgi:beta-carotene 3-hydroxylase
MEPITAAVHRWVMHGVGLRLHRSHHRARTRPGWEDNDWFPVMFAAIVLTGFWLGFNGPGLGALIPIGIGVTAYGAAYALVHDVYIHRRVPLFGEHRVAFLDHLADAHLVHHRTGGAPYGMLVPMMPQRARAHR